MDAVRRSTFRNLLAGSRSRRLRELRFLHLRAGLATSEVTWIGGERAPSAAMAADGVESGLDERVQRALSAIRTDLDDFSSDECDGLMFAGYRIADLDFRARPSALADTREYREAWPFLRVRRMMEPGTYGREHDDFAYALECGRYSMLRKVRLSRPVRWLRRRFGSYPSGRG